MNKKGSKFSFSKYWIFSCVIAIGFALLFSKYIVSIVIVPTESMEPTIFPQDKLLLNRLAYVKSRPCLGDVVAFHYKDQIYIKRIVGCPGMTIECKNSTIYINGEVNELLTQISNEKINDFGPISVLEDCYFVIGDNRSNSDDSRFWETPWVMQEEILGKVFINLTRWKRL